MTANRAQEKFAGPASAASAALVRAVLLAQLAVDVGDAAHQHPPHRHSPGDNPPGIGGHKHPTINPVLSLNRLTDPAFICFWIAILTVT